MNVVVALAVGYFVGAKTRGSEFDQLGQSLRKLCETDEFADVIAAARAQVGTTLRELATMIDGDIPKPRTDVDLVAQVRHLVGRD